MNDMQDLIVSMASAALTSWVEGVESPLFPPSENTNKTWGSILWNLALNSMAYGYERGVEKGYQMAKTEIN